MILLSQIIRWGCQTVRILAYVLRELWIFLKRPLTEWECYEKKTNSRTSMLSLGARELSGSSKAL